MAALMWLPPLHQGGHDMDLLHWPQQKFPYWRLTKVIQDILENNAEDLHDIFQAAI